jgi:hypothetical protein
MVNTLVKMDGVGLYTGIFFPLVSTFMYLTITVTGFLPEDGFLKRGQDEGGTLRHLIGYGIVFISVHSQPPLRSSPRGKAVAPVIRIQISKTINKNPSNHL